MSEDTTKVIDAANIPIGIEQICAAILEKLGPVEIEIEHLLKDYSGKSISVSQDEDSQAITFTLAEVPAENQ